MLLLLVCRPHAMHAGQPLSCTCMLMCFWVCTGWVCLHRGAAQGSAAPKTITVSVEQGMLSWDGHTNEGHGLAMISACWVLASGLQLVCWLTWWLTW